MVLLVKNMLSSAGDTGLIPGWGTKIPYATGQLSLCAAMKTQCLQTENKQVANPRCKLISI